MLCELTIENVAVIEKATVLFEKGFNVLTGETGAGKSILIDSINAILGNRTSRDVVRTGAEKAVIWASFRDVPPKIMLQIQDAGYECDGELLLYREISKDGKSVCRINGKPATAAIIREVCSELINIHGQHDNQSLLNPSKHLNILDNFANDAPLITAYQKEFTVYKNIEKQLQSFTMSEDEKLHQLDLLQFQVDEITMANLQLGEEESLISQKNMIKHSERILSELTLAYNTLSGIDTELGANDLLANADNAILSIKDISGEILPISERLSAVYYEATEIAFEIKNYLDNYDFDISMIDEIEERLDLLYKLKQKYGNSIEDILAFAENAAEQIKRITFAEDEMCRLESEKEEAYQMAMMLASKLTAARISAFEALSLKIKSALSFLNMPDVEFVLQASTTDLTSTGQDLIEFYASTNVGEIPKPLTKIASGGELSRIMLAIKNAMADKDSVPSLIYDEIDAGLGGSAAGKVGYMLKNTADNHQVICVTHTGQIAACADSHLYIEKKVEKGRTFTNVKQLNEEEQVIEIARMLQGDNLTQLAIENAKELIAQAKKA